MALTENNYVGNGSTVLYSFTFPYLATTDIKVSLDGVLTTSYTLANATTVQFTSAPSNGIKIRIYRETADTSLSSTFYPGSSIRSQDLNNNFTQNLYVTQEAKNLASSASTVASSALSTSNSALTTANSASAASSTAINTANAASTSAASAVNTANAASTAASAATATASAAETNATTAVTTANSALSASSAATNTANSASSLATQAETTANAASLAASNAASVATNATTTANTALSTANSAVTTASAASSTATSASSTANLANSKADQAIAAVSNSINYQLVANVGLIPASPANETYVEVQNSTGLESFTPLSGVPFGFVGDPGLSVRIRYTSSSSTWNWLNYYSNNPEARYLNLSGGTLTGSLSLPGAPSSSTHAVNKSYVDSSDALLLPKSGGTLTGSLNMSTNKVTNVGNPTSAQDAATKNYVDTTTLASAGDTMTGNLAMSGNKVTGLNDPSAAQDAATKNYVDTTVGAISINSIEEGDSSVTVTDTGTGNVAIIADGDVYGLFGSNGINLLKALYQQNSLSLTNQNELQFWEATANGLNSVGFKGPASITSNVTWTLPDADAVEPGYALKSNAAGTLSWSKPVNTIFIGFSRNANGNLIMTYSTSGENTTYSGSNFNYKNGNQWYIGASDVLHVTGPLTGSPKVAFNASGHLILTAS